MAYEDDMLRVQIDIPRTCSCGPLKFHASTHAEAPIAPDLATGMVQRFGAYISDWISAQLNFHNCELTTELNPTGYDHAAARAAQVRTNGK